MALPVDPGETAEWTLYLPSARRAKSAGIRRPKTSHRRLRHFRRWCASAFKNHGDNERAQDVIQIDRRAVHLDFAQYYPYSIYSRHQATIDAILDRAVDEERTAYGTRRPTNETGVDRQNASQRAAQTGVDT